MSTANIATAPRLNKPILTLKRAQTLPNPPIPSSCDLSNFTFMPVPTRIGEDPAMTALSDAEFRAVILLRGWCWRQSPPGSLPDDDKQLAVAAGFDCDYLFDDWLASKDTILDGWHKFSDGRLYHPEITERVLKNWKDRVKWKWREKVARRARMKKDGVQPSKPDETFTNWVARKYPDSVELFK